jgi:hypothetical protein
MHQKQGHNEFAGAAAGFERLITAGQTQTL